MEYQLSSLEHKEAQRTLSSQEIEEIEETLSPEEVEIVEEIEEHKIRHDDPQGVFNRIVHKLKKVRNFFSTVWQKKEPSEPQAHEKVYYGASDVRVTPESFEEIKKQQEEVVEEAKIPIPEPLSVSEYSQFFYIDPTKSYKKPYRHLTNEGWQALQGKLNSLADENGVLSTTKLKLLVEGLETSYRNTSVATRDDEQHYNATQARVLRKKIKEIEGRGEKEVKADIYTWLTEKSESGRLKLTEEGRSVLRYQLLHKVGVYPDGRINQGQLDSFINRLKVSYVNKKKKDLSPEDHFHMLAVRSLEVRRKRMADFDIRESVRVSNSPWQKLLEDIKELPHYRETPTGLVQESLIVPLAAKIWEETTKFCDEEGSSYNRSLDQTMIYRIVAERIDQRFRELLTTYGPARLDLEGDFSRIALHVLGGKTEATLTDDEVKERLSQQLKLAVLQARVETEAPDYILKFLEAEGKEVKTLEQATGRFESEKYLYNHLLQEEKRGRLTPSQKGTLEGLRVLKEQADAFKKRQPELYDLFGTAISDKEKQRLNKLEELEKKESLGEGGLLSDDDRFELNSSRGQIATFEKTQEETKLHASLVESEEDLVTALEYVWSAQGSSRLEIIGGLLSEPWFPDELRKDYEEEREKLVLEKGKERKGVIGANLGRMAKVERALQGISRRLRRKDLDIPSSRGKLQSLYERHLKWLADDYKQAQFKWQLICGLRLLMIGTNLAAGAVHGTTGIGEAGLKEQFESPEHSLLSHDSPGHVDIQQTIHNVGEVVRNGLELVKGLFYKGVTTFEVKSATPTSEELQERLLEYGVTPEVPVTGAEEHKTVTPPEDIPSPEKDEANDIPPIVSPSEYEVESPIATPEVLPSVSEFLLTSGDHSVWNMFLDARLDRLERMPTQEQQVYLGTIGGAENLNNEIICLGIIGTDRTTEGGHRSYEFGHTDQAHLVCYNIRENTATVVTIPRHLDLPENDGGADVAAVTWRDNPESQSGRDRPMGHEIFMRTFTDMSGMPVDGVVEFSMDGAAQFIDAFFPQGVKITIEQGEGFVPENEVLGRIAGYKEGGYKAFAEGETYRFDGEALVAFMRSRFTSKEGYFDREKRASDVMGQLIKVLVDNVQDDPIAALQLLGSATDNMEEIENKGGIRVTWGIEVDDPDPEQAGEKSKLASDFAEILFNSFQDGGNIANLLKLIAAGKLTLPAIQRFQLSPTSEEEALQVVRLNDVIDWEGEKVVSDLVVKGHHHEFSRDPFGYWEDVRNFLRPRINPERTEEPQGTADTPPEKAP